MLSSIADQPWLPSHIKNVGTNIFFFVIYTSTILVEIYETYLLKNPQIWRNFLISRNSTYQSEKRVIFWNSQENLFFK